MLPLVSQTPLPLPISAKLLPRSAMIWSPPKVLVYPFFVGYRTPLQCNTSITVLPMGFRSLGDPHVACVKGLEEKATEGEEPAGSSHLAHWSRVPRYPS